MEDTLRGTTTAQSFHLQSLNPCFNGRYSQSTLAFSVVFIDFSLNPCFNGRYSQSILPQRYMIALKVLILVLMEDTLRKSKT